MLKVSLTGRQKVAKMRLATGNEKSVNLHLLEDQQASKLNEVPNKIWKIGCENAPIENLRKYPKFPEDQKVH